jgi:hypothetical protein
VAFARTGKPLQNRILGLFKQARLQTPSEAGPRRAQA